MAVHRACGTRDPFPYPQLENDDIFFGKRATQVLVQSSVLVLYLVLI